jgi:hypothetical protein
MTSLVPALLLVTWSPLLSGTQGMTHKVHTTVSQRMSPRQNWDHPTPPPAGENVLRGGGEGTYPPAGEGVGGPNSDD